MRHFAQVNTVNGNATTARIVHTHNEVDQCAFSATGMTDNTDHLPCLDLKGNIAHDRSAALVSECNMFDLDISLNANIGRHAHISNLRLFLKDFHDFSERGHKIGDVTRNGGNLHQRRVNNTGVHIELVQCTDVHGSSEEQQVSVHQNEIASHM